MHHCLSCPWSDEVHCVLALNRNNWLAALFNLSRFPGMENLVLDKSDNEWNTKNSANDIVAQIAQQSSAPYDPTNHTMKNSRQPKAVGNCINNEARQSKSQTQSKGNGWRNVILGCIFPPAMSIQAQVRLLV